VVFGKVIAGMDVVKTVEGVGSQSGTTSKKVTVKASGNCLHAPCVPVVGTIAEHDCHNLLYFCGPLQSGMVDDLVFEEK
jgi:hypothetical protein